MLCCESTTDERSAGNPHATFCGSRGLGPRRPGTAGEVPAVYSPRILGAHVSRRSRTLHGPMGIDGFASMRLLSLLFRRASPPLPPC